MQPRLVAIGRSAEDKVILLVNREISFGRHPSNQVVLNDGSVSRYHCCIRRVDDDFHIFDLQSLNGTFINDVAVPKRALRHGDRIRIGKSELLFLIDDTANCVPHDHSRAAHPPLYSGNPATTAKIPPPRDDSF